MKLAIVSDTHGNWPLVRDAIRGRQMWIIFCFWAITPAMADSYSRRWGSRLLLCGATCDACEDAPRTAGGAGGWKLLLCRGSGIM